MLINLTNHTSKNWSKEQLNAAIHLFDSVIDLPFPNVNSMASEEEVMQLVQEYLHMVFTREEEHIAVHVMGEMTFVFSFVKEAMKHDILCVASTSERIVNEWKDDNGDVRKDVIFKFCQFRQYC